MIRSQIFPPSWVYFTALDRRLIKIWLILVSSPIKYSCFTPVTVTSKICPLASAAGRIMASTDEIILLKVNSPIVSTTFPLSILDTSKTSLIRLSKCCPDAVIFFVYSFTFTTLSASFASNEVNPNIAFIGVRISCDILERKVVFELLAICATCSASANCLLCTSRSLSRSFLILFCCLWLKKNNPQQMKKVSSMTTTTK